MTALRHQEPDRVPRDMGGTTATGIGLVAHRRLLEHLQVREETVLASHRGRIAKVPESVLRRFNIDTRGVIPGGGDDLGVENRDGTFADRYGVVRRLPDKDGNWYVIRSPLSGDISCKDVDVVAKGWRIRSTPSPAEGLDRALSDLHSNTEYAVILNLPLGPIQTAHAIRGFQDWLMDVANDPKLAAHLLGTVLDDWLEGASDMVHAAGSNADVLFYADDVAFQNGPMVSPRSYRQLILPVQKRVLQSLHDWSDARILYHCCGSVNWLLDNLVDMGVDAINPLQVNALGMGDTASLKGRYGDQIAFWGGVDTSEVLPRGNEDDVRAEVRRRVNDLAPGGGYVLAAVHNIQGDVPPENICAMWDADVSR